MILLLLTKPLLRWWQTNKNRMKMSRINLKRKKGQKTIKVRKNIAITLKRATKKASTTVTTKTRKIRRPPLKSNKSRHKKARRRRSRSDY